MTLPFGTRVSLNVSRSGRIGVVTGSNIRSDGTMAYAVAWSDRHPNTYPGWYDAAELTPIPDPFALRVVRDLNPNGQDVVWGYVAADGRVTGIPHPHRIVPRVRDDAASAYIVGPDPALLIPVE